MDLMTGYKGTIKMNRVLVTYKLLGNKEMPRKRGRTETGRIDGVWYGSWLIEKLANWFSICTNFVFTLKHYRLDHFVEGLNRSAYIPALGALIYEYFYVYI